jgi:hypothetical protein
MVDTLTEPISYPFERESGYPFDPPPAYRWLQGADPIARVRISSGQCVLAAENVLQQSDDDGVVVLLKRQSTGRTARQRTGGGSDVPNAGHHGRRVTNQRSRSEMAAVMRRQLGPLDCIEDAQQ